MEPSTKPTRRVVCERCGSAFGCRPERGERCWCGAEAFRLPMPLPEGAGPYADCLCPSCLRAVATELAARKEGSQSLL